MNREKDSASLKQIGDLARRAGISVRAVRYYEELGLVVPAAHSAGGFRLYGEDDLKRLKVITFLKELGLTLSEIGQILLAKKQSGGGSAAVQFLQNAFKEKLSLVDSKLQALGKMRAELAGVLRLLDSCQHCDHEVLLDAIWCDECSSLAPREAVPSTFDVILQ